MKFRSIMIVSAIAIGLSGCSSFGSKDQIEAAPISAINTQKLTSSFKRQGIKVEWDCVWGTGLFDATCIRTDLKAIEATGYATSFGNSEVLREQAFKVAHDAALDRMVRFVKQIKQNAEDGDSTALKMVQQAFNDVKYRNEQKNILSDEQLKTIILLAADRLRAGN